MNSLFGGIEAGGTKFVCGVGTNPGDFRQIKFATTTPDETLERAITFLREHRESLAAIGIASFGPVDLDPHSPHHGYITSTPKLNWAFTDIAGTIQRALDVPVAFDTDVNAAALAEQRWGAARGLDDFIYLTIGTGIGGGAMVNGQLLHGLVHTEMGHIRIPHDMNADPFAGACPFHGDCFEGLASGPAIEKRWGAKPESLPAKHPAWELEANYVALAVSNFICALSPRRIVIGGGVMRQAQLFPMVRKKVHEYLNGYVRAPEILENMDSYIEPSELGERSGVIGAIAMAEELMKRA